MYYLQHLLIVILILLFGAPVRSELLIIGMRDDVYDPDMLKASKYVQQAALASGNTIEFSYLPAKRSLRLASSGSLDGEFYRHTIIEPLYPSLMRVDVVLGNFDYYIWVYAENNCMEDWEALTVLKPAGARGVIFFESRVYPISKVGYEQVTRIGTIMELLKRGRADYTVHNPSVIQQYSQQTGIKLKRCFDTPLFSMNFYLYLHESKRHLISDLEQALRDTNIESNKPSILKPD